jgi:hypothetical protein
MKHALVALATLVLSLPVPAQSWLTNGLVAHYQFDGNAIDVSGNNADGTLSNVDFNLDRFSASYRAAVFAGSSGSYIAIKLNELEPRTGIHRKRVVQILRGRNSQPTHRERGGL